MVTLWDKAQDIKINADKKKVGNFDIGFDEEIPEKIGCLCTNIKIFRRVVR